MVGAEKKDGRSGARRTCWEGRRVNMVIKGGRISKEAGMGLWRKGEDGK